MTKYYKVLKDTPLWIKGAIIKSGANNGAGYNSTDDVYLTCDHSEYLSTKIIESQPEWFQRVFLIERIGRSLFLTRKEAVDKLEELDAEE